MGDGKSILQATGRLVACFVFKENEQRENLIVKQEVLRKLALLELNAEI